MRALIKMTEREVEVATQFLAKRVVRPSPYTAAELNGLSVRDVRVLTGLFEKIWAARSNLRSAKRDGLS